MSDKLTLPLLNVEIERGRDTITVAVPEHEVRVLQAVHTAGNVRVVDIEDPDDQEEAKFSSSADDEFMRLQGKYRRVNAPDYVLAALRDGPESLTKYGFKMGRGGSTAAPQSMVINHGKEARKAAKKAAATKGK